jgi:hypothetical protein
MLRTFLTAWRTTSISTMQMQAKTSIRMRGM